jgi:AcrR family transcriptional regulator
MPRPSRLDQQRQELMPILARAFVELGYRRTTTAELARRCGVAETILYRHFRDKSAMFVAALDYVHELSIATWQRVLGETSRPADGAAELLDYEARHLGEFGNYRIIFTALGDIDDPEIARALRRMYQGFFRLIRQALLAARRGREGAPDAAQSAWAVIGLGTIATIAGELGLLSGAQRRRLIGSVGRALIGEPRS